MKSALFDLVIRNGVVYDGSGEEPRRADIAIVDDTITKVGTFEGQGKEEIDATGCIVTPGFVDIHTHYDGQAIWSSRFTSSSSHGVTTVVIGNCGVGFAPCRPGDRQLLISAMEGVEDIPEVVMTHGLTWDWETYPEFLDVLESKPHDVDFASYLPHSALRVYVMGERGANRETATPEDLKRMETLTREAMQAGALGFASSSIFAHRRNDGQPIPTYEVAEEELQVMAGALDGRVFQIVPELVTPNVERSQEIFNVLQRVADQKGATVIFTLAQVHTCPSLWRSVLQWMDDAKASGSLPVHPSVFPRPVGMIVGHNLSNNPFLLCPSYQALKDLAFEEKIAELRKPEVRARIVSETPGDPTLPITAMGRQFDFTFPLSDPPNYEPSFQTSIKAQAERDGVTSEELAYDLLLEDDGHAVLYVAFSNYSDGNLDFVFDMLHHPDTVIALGDGGAHYGLICDASYTTFVLAHLARDRTGERLPLAQAIKALTSTPANLVGLGDRGMLAPGYKASINVIDHDNLQLKKPEVCFDLPAGGRRLVQRATGYRFTIVNGKVIARDDTPTGILPGKLVRGRQHIDHSELRRRTA